MKCLSIEQIYLYLEKELVGAENKKIEQHLSSCPKCKEVLEERKFFHQAIESLPSWQVPSGFTQQIMDRIFPAKVSLWGWLTALASGFLAFILGLAVYFLGTGQNLSSLFINLYQTPWMQIKNFSLFFIKFFKLILVTLKIIYQLLEHILSGFLPVVTIIDAEIQILIVAISILASSFFIIYGMRRKILTGEKQ